MCSLNKGRLNFAELGQIRELFPYLHESRKRQKPTQIETSESEVQTSIAKNINVYRLQIVAKQG